MVVVGVGAGGTFVLQKGMVGMYWFVGSFFLVVVSWLSTLFTAGVMCIYILVNNTQVLGELSEKKHDADDAVSPVPRPRRQTISFFFLVIYPLIFRFADRGAGTWHNHRPLLLFRIAPFGGQRKV